MTRRGVLNIGFGNLVVASRLVAVLVPGPNPVRRLREEARNAGKLVDATHGRRCRSVLVVDSGHIILSAVQPETLSQRYEAVRSAADPSDGEVISSTP